jgi:hypothetical protein
MSVSFFKQVTTVFNAVNVVVELNARKGKVVFLMVVRMPRLIKRF